MSPDWLHPSLLTQQQTCPRSHFPDTLVLPFLWAQDGFSEPSEEMAAAIRFGLEVPVTISKAGGVGLVLVGGTMILAFLTWYLVTRRIILVPTET